MITVLNVKFLLKHLNIYIYIYIYIYCNIVNVFTDIFNQLNASLLNINLINIYTDPQTFERYCKYNVSLLYMCLFKCTIY